MTPLIAYDSSPHAENPQVTGFDQKVNAILIVDDSCNIRNKFHIYFITV